MINEFLKSNSENNKNIKAIEKEVNYRIIPLLKTINSKYSDQIKWPQDNVQLRFEKLYIKENWFNIKTNEKCLTKEFMIFKQNSFTENEIMLPLNFLEMSNEQIIMEVKND